LNQRAVGLPEIFMGKKTLNKECDRFNFEVCEYCYYYYLKGFVGIGICGSEGGHCYQCITQKEGEIEGWNRRTKGLN